MRRLVCLVRLAVHKVARSYPLVRLAEHAPRFRLHLLLCGHKRVLVRLPFLRLRILRNGRGAFVAVSPSGSNGNDETAQAPGDDGNSGGGQDDGQDDGQQG